MANLMYLQAKYLEATTGINWTTATIKCRLIDNTYNAAAQVLVAVDMTGTTAHRHPSPASDVTVSTCTATKNTTTGKVKMSADSEVFVGVDADTFPVAGCIYYIDGASEALRIPVVWFDTNGFPFAGTGSDVTVAPDATNGLWDIS